MQAAPGTTLLSLCFQLEDWRILLSDAIAGNHTLVRGVRVVPTTSLAELQKDDDAIVVNQERRVNLIREELCSRFQPVLASER